MRKQPKTRVMPSRPRTSSLLNLVLFGFFLTLTWVTPAQANEESAGPVLDQSLSTQERKDLLARLSDQQVRDLIWNLIENESTQTEKKDTGLTRELDQIGTNIRNNLASLTRQSSQLVGIPANVMHAMTPEGQGSVRVFTVLLGLALMIAAGWAGQRLMRIKTRGFEETLNQVEGENFPQRLGRRLLLFLYDLLSPAVLGISAYIVFQILYQGHEPNRLLALGLISAIVTAMILVRVVHLVLSPNRPNARLTPLNDQDAKKVSSSLSGILILGTAMFFFSGYLGQVLPPESAVSTVGLVNFIGTIFLMVLMIVFMWRVRTPIAALIMSGKSPGLVRKLFANTWPVIGSAAVLLLLALGIVSALGLNQRGVFNDVLQTLLVILIITPLALGTAGPLIREWGFKGGSTPIADRRAGLVKLARIAVMIVIALSLGNIWDIDIVAVTRSKLGEAISQAGLQVIVTLIVANLAWSATKRWIESRQQADISDDEGGHAEAGGDPGGQGLTRIATILPLLRGTLLAVITAVAVMVSLSSLGVDTGPLIAAASVFGLAVGFGAQTLVADIISGIFFLVDDAFRKGEYIDVGGNTGTVEKISVRSMQLRHHNGPVHTIPYSTISTLTNFSRDWVIMKFELRIPFEENVEKVRKLIKKVGQKLLEDPEHGPEFLEPLKSQGVNRMDDSAFVVRCKFSTKPGKQWAIRRIAYAAIQDAFAEAGIKFAPKRVVVEAVTSEAAIAGAAAQSSQDQQSSDTGASR